MTGLDQIDPGHNQAHPDSRSTDGRLVLAAVWCPECRDGTVRGSFGLRGGIVVLPVHDSFLVPASKADELEGIMIDEAAKFGAKVSGPIN